MTPSLLDMNQLDYHAHPALSSTTIRDLITKTPAHAIAARTHRKDSAALDEGTILHALLLGEEERIRVVPYPDFKTKAAQQERDAIRAAGLVPVTETYWGKMQELGGELRAAVAAHPIDPPLFVNGVAEQTILWDEPHPRTGEPIASRARPDWLGAGVCDDLKKSRSAAPREWTRAFWSYRYDLQAAWYLRGIRAAGRPTPIFRWAAFEVDPPYALSVFVLSPDALTAAQARIDEALEIWADCLATDVWPAYPQTVNVVELPPWMSPVEWDDTALTEVPF